MKSNMNPLDVHWSKRTRLIRSPIEQYINKAPYQPFCFIAIHSCLPHPNIQIKLAKNGFLGPYSSVCWVSDTGSGTLGSSSCTNCTLGSSSCYSCCRREIPKDRNARGIKVPRWKFNLDGCLTSTCGGLDKIIVYVLRDQIIKCFEFSFPDSF